MGFVHVKISVDIIFFIQRFYRKQTLLGRSCALGLAFRLLFHPFPSYGGGSGTLLAHTQR